VKELCAKSCFSECKSGQEIDVEPPTIKLIGKKLAKYNKISQCSTFEDPGVIVEDNADKASELQASVQISFSHTAADGSSLDTSVAGKKTIKYDVQDSSGNNAETVKRWVEVVKTQPSLCVDVEPPTLKIVGKFLKKYNTVQQCEPYIDPGATASDNVDNDEEITGRISVALKSGKPLPLDTSKVGTFILEYNVADLAGNDAEPVTRIVQVVPSLDVSPGATCESP